MPVSIFRANRAALEQLDFESEQCTLNLKKEGEKGPTSQDVHATLHK